MQCTPASVVGPAETSAPLSRRPGSYNPHVDMIAGASTSASMIGHGKCVALRRVGRTPLDASTKAERGCHARVEPVHRVASRAVPIQIPPQLVAHRLITGDGMAKES